MSFGQEPKSVPSRRSIVTQTLRAAIISGEMETGLVYSAPALAAQFGVSPTPVREAMLDLTKEGLVEVARNKGFRVISPSEQELDDILELRRLLEVPTVTEIANIGASEDALADLASLAEATIKAAEHQDARAHVAADIAFHVALLQLSGNSQLVEMVRVLRSKSRLYGLRSAANAARLVATSREHLHIVGLVQRRDAGAAEVLMRRHISHVRLEWRRS